MDRNKVAKYNYKRYRLNRYFVDNFKNRPCADCFGWFEPYQMDFDHRPSEKKVTDIATYMTHAKRSNLLLEIKKCDVVCANCHRLRTHNRKYGYYKP